MHSAILSGPFEIRTAFRFVKFTLGKCFHDFLLFSHQRKLILNLQAAIRPPTFVFFVNDAKLFPETYRRYMEKKLRSDAGFPGTPIRLLWRSRKRPDKKGESISKCPLA